MFDNYAENYIGRKYRLIERKMSDLKIRQIRREEYPVLEDFLYNAIFLPPDTEPVPREIIFEPEIYMYVENFGGKDDCGVVAEQDGQIIGAAWTRIIPAYGHIDNETPEPKYMTKIFPAITPDRST